MGLSPWYVSQIRPIWSIQENQDASVFGGLAQPLNLAGATITLHYKATDSAGSPTGSDIVGINNGVITSAANGQFTFQPAATDTFVTTAGTYIFQWKFDYGAGQEQFSDFFTIQVLATV
jgi:hypothetical protein